MNGARKRPRWLQWLPAALLLVIIVAVAVTTAVLLRGGLGQPAPAPTQGQVTELNWSVFTPEGVDYIARTRTVRIDLSSAPVDSAALGIAPDDTLVLEQVDTGDTVLHYDLIINGGGEGPGGARFIASQITIVTAGGVVESVSAQLSEVLNFRQTLAELQNNADVWGWDVSAVAAIFATAERATREGIGYKFAFGPADQAGVPMGATARCDTSGFCVVTYTATPARQ